MWRQNKVAIVFSHFKTAYLMMEPAYKLNLA